MEAHLGGDEMAAGAAFAGALTVDVEEYFHTENLRGAAPPWTWGGFPSRVEPAVERLLDLLDEHRATATFFVLGWVAERRPGLVARIAARGHEVASHGHGHERIHELDPRRFRADLVRARSALEDAGQSGVRGYRAPTFSITPRTRWALDVLIEAGFAYDSSIFPVRHDRYGDPGAPIAPYRLSRTGGSIVELPPLVWRVLGRNLPAAGGGYLRLLPLFYTRHAIRRAARERRPAILYVHPWEIDRGQPRLRVGALRALRHYAGIRRVEPRLSRILAAHRFGRAIDLVEAFERTERSALARAA